MLFMDKSFSKAKIGTGLLWLLKSRMTMVGSREVSC